MRIINIEIKNVNIKVKKTLFTTKVQNIGKTLYFIVICKKQIDIAWQTFSENLTILFLQKYVNFSGARILECLCVCVSENFGAARRLIYQIFFEIWYTCLLGKYLGGFFFHKIFIGTHF